MPHSRRLILGLAAAVLAWAGAAQPLAAQTTTGTIVGTVTSNGQPVDEAQVQVTNPATGYSVGVRTTDQGRYVVPGLEVGSSYNVVIRRIGFEQQARENVRVTLGQSTRVDFTLVTQATVLTAVTTTGAVDALITPSRTSVSTTVSDTALRRLPTLNRNFTDFVALTPQVSSSGPGLSGGGTNNRYNTIQIDGATESDLFGLGSTGQPGGQAGGKSIGIESVKEYQVLLAPFDVRQGNFAGALINAVTKNGTNEFEGSAVYSTRNQGLARSQPYINRYEQTQYGFSVGGPIIRNRAFFFINPEFQRRESPAFGEYIGLATTTIRQSTVDSINALVQGYGLPSGGSAGLSNIRNPLHNFFGRIDVNLPRNSQLVLRHNYGFAQDDNFDRSASSFRLTSNAYFFQSTKNATVMQLRSLFGSGGYNELIVNRTSIRDRRTPVQPTGPQINVIVPGYTVQLGAERSSQGNQLDQDIWELTDNFTLPLGAHRVTLGTQNQFYKVRNLFAQQSQGFWTFGSLDSLRIGRPRAFQVGVPVVGDGAVRFDAASYSGYVQDEWSATPRLNVTIGLRADIPVFNDKPPYNKEVRDSLGILTNEIPSGNVEWSPRVGFNWNITGDDANQLRGGAGMFAGRPAMVWLSNAFQNSGLSGVAQLNCNNPTLAPQFTSAAAATPPTACTDGRTAATSAQLDLLDPDLKFPQNFRATLGYDRRLTQNWVATVEGMYTKGVNGLFYQNIALKGPQGTDKFGRVIYGLTPGTPVRRVANRTQALYVTNQSNDHAHQLTGGLQRRYADRYEGSIFYTYSRAFDAQSFTSSTGVSQYQFGRVWGGDQSDTRATRSLFEQRHRIVAQGTYSFPTRTDLTLLYFGESGNPYDYTVNADLNGDGFNSNDPIYVPRLATDPQEMAFQSQTYSGRTYTAAEQAQAFENFIRDTPCLNDNRGRLVPRNACENPWSHRLNVSARQSLPTLWAQNLSLQLDVFNFLNLLNKEWGEQSTAGRSPVTLLDYRGRTGSANIPSSTLLNSQPIFSFNPNYRKFLSNSLSSNYQIQLQVRYSF